MKLFQLQKDLVKKLSKTAPPVVRELANYLPDQLM